jgi:hypothetical protein
MDIKERGLEYVVWIISGWQQERLKGPSVKCNEYFGLYKVRDIP